MDYQESCCSEFGEVAITAQGESHATDPGPAFIAPEALFPWASGHVNSDSLFQHLNTTENVTTVDGGLQYQHDYHENRLNGSPAMIEIDHNTAGNAPGDNRGLHLTDSTEQWQSTGVIEAPLWDQYGDLGSFTEHALQSSLLHPQVFDDVPITLDPRLLEQHATSLDTIESMAASTKADATISAHFVPESSSTALVGVEPACTQQQHDQLDPLHLDVANSAPAEDPNISQEVATSVITRQSRFRPLVPKQNPPGYEPKTSSDAGGRKRRRSRSLHNTRLILNSGVPESCLHTFAITACSEGTLGHRPTAPLASKRTKKQGSACKRCRDDRKKCSSGIPCERCREMVLGLVVYHRVKRLQSSTIGWTCYFDSKIEDLNVFTSAATSAIRTQHPITSGKYYEIIETARDEQAMKTDMKKALRDLITEKNQAYSGHYVGLLDSIIQRFERLESLDTLQSQVNNEVLRTKELLLLFSFSMVSFREFADLSDLNLFRSIRLMISITSYGFFRCLATVLGNIWKGKSLTSTSRMVLIEILNMIPVIVGPIFSMRLHQIIVATVKVFTKLYWDQVNIECLIEDLTLYPVGMLLEFQEIVCTGAFKLVHLAEMTAYWLQHLGAPLQVDRLEDQGITKFATASLLVTRNPRNALEDARLFYGRLERCRQLQTVDSELELLTSFDDANVDRIISLDNTPDPEALQDIKENLEYNTYAALRFIYLIYMEARGRDDESGNDGDEMESDIDCDCDCGECIGAVM